MSDTPPAHAHQPTDTPPRRGLGPWMSMAMVVGTLIGSGIFLMPAVLAPYGPNIPFAWMISIGGTFCIAYCLAQLARRIPGGPVAYMTSAFGEFPAYFAVWSYIITIWAGIAAVALAMAGALSYVFPATGTSGGIFVLSAGSVLLLAALNLIGVRTAGRVQVIATLIKIIPLALVILFVAGNVGTGEPLQPLAATPITGAGIIGAASLTLFSLTGFEVGAITAPVTENAERNIPRAQIWGVAFTGLLYLAATMAVLWVLPSEVVAQSKAPFADAITPVLGPIAGVLVAIIVAISAFGANNALMLGGAEILHSIAKQGDLPPAFARLRPNGVPAAAIIASTVVSITLLAVSSAPSFVEIYAFVSLVSAIGALLLYALCSAAAIKLKRTGGGLGTMLAVIAIVYAIAMFFGAGWKATSWGIALALTGIPIRWISRRLWPIPPAADGRAAPAEPAA
ncbi:APC family permease [Sphingomonas sabuli]|uniref:Arginine/agmatine antiporter n=1 Tax=Sphingomonas sabuli TaxID=2764186 RepID=A0A7G9L4J1_9SPHN|nr:APC family permease [Sphingomonas sabuli]QNM83540.1 APC family permease [Sphingomonas sabuli]